MNEPDNIFESWTNILSSTDLGIIHTYVDNIINTTNDNNKLLLICGGPRTGKTKLLNDILKSINFSPEYYTGSDFNMIGPDFKYNYALKTGTSVIYLNELINTFDKLTELFDIMETKTKNLIFTTVTTDDINSQILEQSIIINLTHEFEN